MVLVLDPTAQVTVLEMPAGGAVAVVSVNDAFDDPDSEDPQAPGVLVLESSQTGTRRILLRFGADANRRDDMLFDGAYTVLEVREIAADGFAGNWRSGLRLSRLEGYFCARREF